MMDSMNFPLGHGLQQRDGAGQGRREIFQRHGKRDGMARLFSAAQRNSFPTPSKTVMSSPRFGAKPAARDAPRVRQAGGGAGATFGWQIKAVHKQSDG